ncbi:hypothetical protein F5888DRAFT_1806527 [Russula emetica]|nr:hypothetical protein F5888DRAFT_1806527 [Russula emetica]
MLSDSEDDERLKKKKKSRCASGTPSTSRDEFEKEKAKRIASNKMLLLKLKMTNPPSAAERIEDVDQEPGERGWDAGEQDAGDAELVSRHDAHTEEDAIPEIVPVPRENTDRIDETGDATGRESRMDLEPVDPSSKVGSPSESPDDACPPNNTCPPNDACHNAGSESQIDTVPRDGQAQAHASSEGISGITDPLAGDCSRLASPFITLDPPEDSFYANKWFASWLAHF